MTRWRVAVAAGLVLVVGLPVALPFLDLLLRPGAWRAWAETERLLLLGLNTARLVAGTLALAVPAGVAAAVLLYRTDLPFRGTLRFGVVLTLFVPLPLFASGWQAALGSGGWLPSASRSTPPEPDDPDRTPTGVAWKPWAQGLPAAVWVHAVAGLPWVVLLVGQGLCWVEREAEEDALTDAGPWRVLGSVTLVRARAAVGAAALWVALQAATEVGVTDMMQVRTFAEEVYTQFVRTAGAADVVARAVVVSVPAWLLTVGLVLWAARAWERNLPPLDTLRRRPLLFSLGAARWPVFVLLLVAAGVLVGAPLASLVWKAGRTPGDVWSAAAAGTHVRRALDARGGLVVESLGLAAATGAVTAAAALVACWLALRGGWFRWGLLGLLAAAWALPGPVVGIGLKAVVGLLLNVFPSGVVADTLYYGPSPLPGIWAGFVRFLPCAVALLWPVVRLLPRELLDAARVEGARPYQELGRVVAPLCAAAAARAGLAVAVLSLGELSAGKLIETPGSRTFAHEVFQQMHTGVTNDLAALCLILLAAVLAGGALVAACGRWAGGGAVS